MPCHKENPFERVDEQLENLSQGARVLVDQLVSFWLINLPSQDVHKGCQVTFASFRKGCI